MGKENFLIAQNPIESEILKLFSKIDDPISRADFFRKWIEAYQPDLENPQIDVLFKAWSDEIGAFKNKLLQGQVRLERAKSLLTMNKETEAQSEMDKIYQELFASDSSETNSEELSAFIQTCFAKKELFPEAMKNAIYKVIVLSDSWKKVYILTELANQYIESRQIGADLFVQFAMASVNPIKNPFLKAEGFARIAASLDALKDIQTAEVYWNNAKEILSDLNILSLSPNDEISLTNTIVFFAKKGFTNEVNGFLTLLQNSQLKIEVYRALAENFIQKGQVIQFRLQVQKIINGFGQVNTDNVFTLIQILTDLCSKEMRNEDFQFIENKIAEMLSQLSIGKSERVFVVTQFLKLGRQDFAQKMGAGYDYVKRYLLLNQELHSPDELSNLLSEQPSVWEPSEILKLGLVLAKAGKVEEAKSYLSFLPDSASKLEFLIGIFHESMTKK